MIYGALSYLDMNDDDRKSYILHSLPVGIVLVFIIMPIIFSIKIKDK